MAGLFDKNGNATETHIATVSGFDPETGEHIATYEVRIFAGTGIPGFSTLIEAPAAEAGHTVCWDGSQWQQVTDLRGSKAYQKATAVVVTVKTLGILSDELTFIAPTTVYDYWNGSAWVTDIEAQHSADVATAELQRSTLLGQADEIMQDWRDELALGLISDANKAKLTEWLNYKKQVKAIDISTAFTWPTLPAQ